MPMYEYRCNTCAKSFEQLRRMRDSDEDVRCPTCESDKVERLLSGFATSSGGGGGCAPGSGGRFT